MSIVSGFEPLFRPDAKILVLGSMPGVASLKKLQYYGHPRNVFWQLLAGTFQTSLPECYEDRVALLFKNKVAVWDVLQCCERQGSLDSSIVRSSERANDFLWLFSQIPSLKRILFNGKKAQQCFDRHVKPQVASILVDIECRVLPSTSPANASIDLEKKRQSWSAAFSFREP